MKIPVSLLVSAGLAVLLILLSGCATYENNAQNSQAISDEKVEGMDSVQVDNPSIKLDDYLRQISGVIVSGNGPTASVKVRGLAAPLFVMDGVTVGRSFSRIYNLVNMMEVNEINVLKGFEAFHTYGFDGTTAVIEINTEKKFKS